MSKLIKVVVGVGLIAAGIATGNFQLVFAGLSQVGGALLAPKDPSRNRAASAATLQIGEVPRQAILGRAAVAGSLVDAFNYGGKNGTDWEVLVIALADHRCDALEGMFVNDTFVAFAADGAVAGFNGQLEVYWRPGTATQTVPAVLTANGPGWTANDRGKGVAWVTVAYKADAADAKNPVWPGGRPRFRWVVRGLRCYDPRKDTTAGGAGAHRWTDPATWEWSENPIVCRYNWVRGIFATDLVVQPEMLLVGRGLSEIEAPAANVFARANLCDEVVDGAARYRIGGLVAASEAYIDVENDIAAACAGTIVQPEGSVEIDPGEARAPVASFTDDDLIVGSKVTWSDFLGTGDSDWINTAVATFTDPGQGWKERSAPPRRDLADIAADGSPREQQIRLVLVSWMAQAQRVAEIARRLGRLWGRGQVTLPPRFAGIEEGDWVTWQSDRHFGGATLTFRVEAWGSDQAWHHQLTLRQISASVFSDTAPLDDGSVAAQQDAPGDVPAPAPGAWALTAVTLPGAAGVAGGQVLVVAGATDDPDARLVRMEYFAGSAAPGVGEEWTDAGVVGPEVVRREIAVAEPGFYMAAVSYVIGGTTGARLVLGPVVAGNSPVPGNRTFISDYEPLPFAVDVTPGGSPAFSLTLADFVEGDVWFAPTSNTTKRWNAQTGAWSGNLADVTAAGQVTVVPPVPQTIFRTFDGTPKTGQFPRTLTPGVTKGGVDFRTDNSVSYSIVNSNVTATVNNTNGSADKGRITVTAGAAGSITLTVTVGGVAQPPFVIPFIVQDDLPPAGGTTDSASLNGTGVNSTTFVDIAALELSTGPASTQVQITATDVLVTPDAAVSGVVNVEFKVQWESAPSTRSDVGSATNSNPDPVVSSGEPTDGVISIDVTKTGLSSSTAQKFWLMARNTTGTRLHTFGGSVSADGG